MLSRFLGSSTDSQAQLIAEVRNELKTAREQLWDGTSLSIPEATFKDVERRLLKACGSDKPQGDFADALGEARLGLWAIRYHADPQMIEGYRPAAKLFADAQHWPRFVVRVMLAQKEQRLPALQVYLYYLNNKQDASVLPNFRELIESITTPGSNPKGSAEAATKAKILKRLAELSVKHVWVYQRLAQFALMQDDFLSAKTYLEQALGLKPGDHFTYRLFGYWAEKQADYKAAQDYYRRAEAWLRLAVVCCKQQDYPAAEQALAKVTETERQTDVWQYYAGLVCFQQGQYEACIEHWRILRKRHADDKALFANMKLAADRLLCERLKDGQIPASLPDGAAISSFFVEAQFRQALSTLWVEKQPQLAKPLLQQLSGKYPVPLMAQSHLAVCVAAEHNQLEADRKLYSTLRERAGTGAVFLLLRGLWLLQAQPAQSVPYLSKALIELSPLEQGRWIAAAALRIAFQRTQSPVPASVTGLPEWQVISEPHKLPAVVQSISRAVAATVCLDAVGKITNPSLTHSMENPSPGLVTLQAIDRAVQGKLVEAFEVIKPHMDSGQKSPVLRNTATAIVEQLIQQALQAQQWGEAAGWLRQGLSVNPRHRFFNHLTRVLSPFLLEQQWREHDWGSLTEQLTNRLRQHPDDSRLHRNLALVYTAQALAEDEHSPSPAWGKALGHWAVVLADDGYWKKWQQARQAIYETDLPADAVQSLRNDLIPDQLSAYHREQTNKPGERSQHHYYAALLSTEVDAARTLRNAIQTAERQKIAVPPDVKMLRSPALITTYGQTAPALTFIQQIANLPVLKEDARWLRQMISPLGPIQALINAGSLVEALDELRVYILNNNDDDALALFVDTAIRRNEQILEANQFDEARHLANEALVWCSDDPQVLHQLAQASVGWASALIQDEKFEPVITELRRVLALVPGSADLRSTLADALIQWGRTLIDDKHQSEGINRIQEALNIDKNNIYIKQEAAVAYRILAIQAAEEDWWQASYDNAAKALELDKNDSRSVLLVVMVGHDWALSFYRARHFTLAMKKAEAALSMAIDAVSSFEDEGSKFEEQIEAIGNLLSNIYNDYGVSLAQMGQTYEARRYFREALRLNPSNTAAYHNLH